jgi:hypothetical protein
MGATYGQGTDPAQTENMVTGARVSGMMMGGITPGGGGLSGISELLNKSNSGGMVNELTGQPAFSTNLGSISSQNGISYSLNLSYYGGGMDAFAHANPQYAPGGWVGAGFSLKPPYIQVSGEDLILSRQKYYLSMDGSSQQEMIPQGTADYFVLKNDPFIRIHRIVSTRTSILTDRCPNQANQQFTSSTPNISYWTVDLPNGITYLFGSESGHCDETEFELCQPTVGTNLKYNPFYTLQQNGKSAVTFFLSHIMDRQRTTSIWFRYDKVREDVVGSCNSVNTTPTYTTSLDRAVYLKEIYSTNGILMTDYQTSKITLTSTVKTEEPNFISSAANPAAFYENRKLTGLQFYENGNPINTLSFGYTSSLGRMLLQSISAQATGFSTVKSVLALNYVPGTIRLASIQDGLGRIMEYQYGTVEAGAINGTNGSTDFQKLDLSDPSLGAGFPQANTRIAMARQIGNKFYVETENWGAGCTPTPSETFREHLFEYENKGTYWTLKRVINAPALACPTAMDFFLSPDGKYFVWAYSWGTATTKIAIYDLTTDDPSPAPNTFDYTNTGGQSYSTEIFTYPDWFVVHNTKFARNLTFFTKDASGQWTTACPSAIAPSTYDAPASPSPRSNNYSGEDERIEAGSCLTFGWNVEVTPGPNFLVVNNRDRGILHVYANDGGIKDYVKGLETTTPPLPNFTQAEAGDDDLYPLARPWFRTTTNGVRYDNNAAQDLPRIAVSDNLIILEYTTGKAIWKYLYVLGWDGKQLRYLYDSPLLINQEEPDEYDVSAGPDYFVLKNQYGSAGSRKGFFYYKVDLKAWKVIPPSGPLPVPNLTTANLDDWVIKPYSDYFFLEEMEDKSGPTAFTPALVSEATNTGNTDVGGIWYKAKNNSKVFKLDANRYPIDITSEFSTGGQAGQSTSNNFSAQGDRILSVYTINNPNSGSSNKSLTTRYDCWKRNADPVGSPNWTRYTIPNITYALDTYQSSRLVAGGIISSQFKKNSSEESLLGLYFVPDRFELVPKASDPSQSVQASTVVTKIMVKTNGPASTGNDVQEITFSFPAFPPDGVNAATSLKNYQSGTPNFKYVRKDFSEGAQISSFYRDELGSKVPPQKNALIGSTLRNWSLPDKASYKKPGGGWDSTSVTTAIIAGQPDKAYAVEKLSDSSRAYFHSAYRVTASHSTNFDSKIGRPKINVAKVGDKYRLTYDQFEQDLTPNFAGPYDLIRQSSAFQFDNNPCTIQPPAENPCGNLDAAWFTSANMAKIISSSIMTYDNNFRLKSVYQWRPDALNGVYPPLNGNPSNHQT